jgi:uncharacterized protein (PEP-CTERM system associated)
MVAEQLRMRRRRLLSASLATGAVLAGELLVAAAQGHAQPVPPGAAPLGLAGPPALRPSDAPVRSGDDGARSPGIWYPDFTFGLPVGRTPPGAPALPWSLQPSIEIQGAATDNLLNTSADRRADVYTVISPQLNLAADTASLVGALTYRPRLQLHADSTEQDRLDQVFSGQALATLVPDLLFLDMRGNGGVQSVLGDFERFGNSTDDRRTAVRSTSYQISPYLVQRLGGLATVQVGYRFSQSIESGRTAFAPGQSQPFFTDQDLVGHEGYAVLRSGDDWGRLAFEARTVNGTFQGSGVYDGSHRYVHTLQLRYALTRAIAVLGEGGYEDQRYNGVQPLIIQDPTWGVGLRYAPDDESFLTVRYGRHDGGESFSLNGALLLGVRTRLSASYNERLSSSVLLASDLLTSLQVDALGNVVDVATGMPAAIAFSSPLLAVQSGLFRIRRGTLAVSQAWLRDTFTLGLVHEERTPAAIAPGTIAFAQESVSASLAWTRMLAPTTTLTSIGQYGVVNSDVGSEGTSLAFHAILAQAFSPSLAGTLQYRLSSGEDATSSKRTLQNTVIVTLRQFF